MLRHRQAIVDNIVPYTYAIELQSFITQRPETEQRILYYC